MIYTIITAKYCALHSMSELGNSEIFFLEIAADASKIEKRQAIENLLKENYLYMVDIVAIYEGRLEDLTYSIL